MKKVVALLASKRKQNTYGMLVQLQQLLAQDGVEVEIIPLYDLHIEDCVGCEKCILTGNCVWHDDVHSIMEKLATADGIILSSPVYLQQVSGKVKTLIDRTCMWYHRPVLYGKPVLCIATTKGSGLSATLAYESSVAQQWGAMPAGQIGRTIRTIGEPITPKELHTFTALLHAPQTYRPPMRELMNFEVQKALAKFLGGLDTAYWARMGWYAAPYYFPCRVNPFKRFAAGMFGAFLQSKLAKNTVVVDADAHD